MYLHTLVHTSFKKWFTQEKKYQVLLLITPIPRVQLWPCFSKINKYITILRIYYLLAKLIPVWITLMSTEL